MVSVTAMSLGGYPRSRYSRRLLRDLERGEVGYGHLEGELRAVAASVIGAQLSAGLPIVVDGMIDWHDIFRPFVESWRNVTATSLLRYFDNNFFYRIPLFTGEPEPLRQVLAPRVRAFSQLADPASLKVVIPGPLTFALMSNNKSGVSDEELAEAIARLLADEARAAVEAGAGAVQIDEPILSDPEATRDQGVLAAELASMMVKGLGATSFLAVYFYSPKREVYEAILDAGVDYIALDYVDSPAKVEELLASKGTGGKGLALGVIDARSIYTDPYERVRSAVEKALKTSEVERLVITTSTWMDLIPYRYSLKKTRLLGVYTERLASDLGLEADMLWR